MAVVDWRVSGIVLVSQYRISLHEFFSPYLNSDLSPSLVPSTKAIQWISREPENSNGVEDGSSLLTLSTFTSISSSPLQVPQKTSIFAFFPSSSYRESPDTEHPLLSPLQQDASCYSLESLFRQWSTKRFVCFLFLSSPCLVHIRIPVIDTLTHPHFLLWNLLCLLSNQKLTNCASVFFFLLRELLFVQVRLGMKLSIEMSCSIAV